MEGDDLRAEWRPVFAVGDELIDAQHRAFFDEVNAVLSALDAGQGRDAVIEFYRSFFAALVTHFRDEEEMLARVAFAGLPEHREEHAALLLAVASVQALLVTSDELSQWRLVVRTLFGALIAHLAGTDMRYKSHLQRAREDGVLPQEAVTTTL